MFGYVTSCIAKYAFAIFICNACKELASKESDSDRSEPSPNRGGVDPVITGVGYNISLNMPL